jgi:hypothetical protein
MVTGTTVCVWYIRLGDPQSFYALAEASVLNLCDVIMQVYFTYPFTSFASFFFVALDFELSALYLLGKHSTASSPFCSGYF